MLSFHKFWKIVGSYPLIYSFCSFLSFFSSRDSHYSYVSWFAIVPQISDALFLFFFFLLFSFFLFLFRYFIFTCIQVTNFILCYSQSTDNALKQIHHLWESTFHFQLFHLSLFIVSISVLKFYLHSCMLLTFSTRSFKIFIMVTLKSLFDNSFI